MSFTADKAIAANRYVHAFLVNGGEYEKSPHFRPENRRKVRTVIERIAGSLPAGGHRKAIDFGCGTGFMIDLMHDLFDEVHGVDITPEMMAKVDRSPGNVFLHECRAESTPFEAGSFDLATAYSFMDHLFDYRAFLQEASRVLKPGGVFYADLNPNRAFISAMVQAERMGSDRWAPMVEREIAGALHNGSYYQTSCGVDGDLLEQAEPIKSRDQGFDGDEVVQAAREVGFSVCTVEHQWFLGEAKVLHGPGEAAAAELDHHLQQALPVSSPLFKYLRFIFTK